MEHELITPSSTGGGGVLTGCFTKAQVKRDMPVILVIPEMAGTLPSPCSYIRLLNPLMTERVQNSFRVRISTLAVADLSNTDIVIMNRIPSEKLNELQVFLKKLRENNVRLVYELDDDLLNIDPNHPEKALYKEKEEIVRTLLSEADLVWVSTEALAQSVSTVAKHVQVLENFIEPKLLELDRQAQPFSNTYRVLYMGTKTHSADLNLVLKPLRKLHSEGAEFELTLIGITPDIPNEDWIKSINPPFSGYPLFMQWLHSLPRFDLAIAPLEETKFNECKSALKFWDYTAIGAPTLASRFGEYKRLIADGETGLLARNDDIEWGEKLRFAFESKTRLQEILHNAVERLVRKSDEINGVERRRNALLELFKPPAMLNCGD